jgi:hypothetical protein
MGYRPVPVTGPDASDCASPGKAPRITDWPTICAEADEAVIGSWSRRYRDHTNTGILCGQVIAIDIDLMDESLVTQIEELARTSLGPTSCVGLVDPRNPSSFTALMSHSQK